MKAYEEEKVPLRSLYDVTQWRRKINKLLIEHYVGNEIAGTLYTQLTKDLGYLLSRTVKQTLPYEINKVDYDAVAAAVKTTLEHEAAGRFMDMSLAEHITNRIAGNTDRLKAGIPVIPWAGQEIPEWVIAMIKEASFYTTPKRHIPGAMLTMYIVSGTPADEIFDQFFTDAALWRLAGLIRMRDKKIPRSLHYRELVRGYLLIKLKSGTALVSEKYQERDSLNKRNKIRTQYRHNYKEECPRQSKWPCHFCYVGYDTCPCGTHKDDYVRRSCINGHLGWFNSKQRSRVCLYCSAKQWIKHN